MDASHISRRTLAQCHLLWNQRRGNRAVRGSPDPALVLTEGLLNRRAFSQFGRPSVGGYDEVGRPAPSATNAWRLIFGQSRWHWASARRLMCEASTHKTPKTTGFIGSKCFKALRSGASGMNCHPEGAGTDAQRWSATEGSPRRSFTSCYSVQDDIETQAYSPSSLEGSLSDRRISAVDPRRSFTSCYSVQDDFETQAYSPMFIGREP